ncbi:TerD family protein [Micromonospora sp. NBC_00421]|uniref:TerD family protein n=1 Tax=Micromonospora sp. NBC_00421 TaxID=2975976 RepID=UPI002E22502E
MPIDYTRRPKGPATPPPGPVSLSKVTLTKAAPAVSLTKQGATTGVLRVNLNWNTGPTRGGMFGRRAASSIDLDLGCLYEFVDGSKGVVQALGNTFQAGLPGFGEPVIWLDGDDRSGNQSGGENLFIDLRHAARIRRILVFALIYEGVPNWAAADGVVTLFPVSGPQVEVRLDESRPGARICAIAMIESVGGDLSVRREGRYIDGGQQSLDRAYGWNMTWTSARK